MSDKKDTFNNKFISVSPFCYIFLLSMDRLHYDFLILITLGRLNWECQNGIFNNIVCCYPLLQRDNK